MEVQKNIGDVLLYFVPALLVLGAMFLLVKKYLDRDYRLKLIEAKQMMQKDMLPLRLQSYERLVLFLERIAPESILMRTNRPGMTSGQLHSELLSTVRTEFEHNLSQQVYMSNAAWEQVKIAKDDIIKIINMASEKTGPNDSAINLSAEIFEVMLRFESLPVQKAVDFLKNEVRQLIMQQ